jgi:protein SCO1
MTDPRPAPGTRPAPDAPPEPGSRPAHGPTAAPGATPPVNQPLDRRTMVFGGIALVAMALVAVGLIALVATGGGGTKASPTPDPSSFAYTEVKAAPPLELTDQDGNPFALTGLAGRPVLVFFGYTHCPDVCPTTVGTINEVLSDVGAGPRVVFVSIDPERDDVAAMASYTKYLPDVYYGLSGSPDQISRNAAGWGVKYARIDQQSDGGYAMAHTADLFLVDGQGRLRAHFPFKTPAASIATVLKKVLAEMPPPSEPPATPTLAPAASASPVASTAAPTPAGPATPASSPSAGSSIAPPTSPVASPVADSLKLTVVSTSIWAGGTTPVIVNIGDAAGAPLDGSVPVSVRITGADSEATGPDVPMTAILPKGERMVSFVAYVTIPVEGDWRLNVIAADGRTGWAPITALDQGTTARIGDLAPDVDTPTLADVGGDLKQLTTVVDAQADDRLYTTSIADARKAGRPYVLVIDSNRFRVSPACGRAITMIRYLLDRWPEVTFTHLEPFVYQVITEEPVLSGSITDPPLNKWTIPWGIGDARWPATEMPWIFVVDGQGVIRAKYTGIVGSADVDIIVSLINGNGVLNP